MHKFARFPFFIFFFSIYPVLNFLAWNIREVEWQIVIRPLIITLVFLLLLWGVLQVLIRDWEKSSLLALVALFLLFSYGHVSNLLLSLTSIGKPNRILLVVYSIAFLLSIWWIFYKHIDPSKIFPWLNLVSLMLISIPLFQIVSYQKREKESTGISFWYYGYIKY